MAHIAIQLADTLTIGAQGTFACLRDQLVSQWGGVPQVYFDIALYLDDNPEASTPYFRKRHEEVAKVTRGGPPLLTTSAGLEVPGARIADTFDAQMAMQGVQYHMQAAA